MAEVKTKDTESEESESEEYDTEDDLPEKYGDFKKKASKIVGELLNHKAKVEQLKDGIKFCPSPHLKEFPKEGLPEESFSKSKRFSAILKNIDCNHIEYSFKDYSKEKTLKASTQINSFILMLELGYYKHYPVTIKPDDIWLLILYGTAIHVNENAEKLRKVFVNHEGKKDLCILRPGFVKGSDKNDWDGVIDEFASLIDNNTKDDIVKLFEPDFTTSTKADKLAARITTMDIMKEYFSYSMMCGCGFPSITLKGNKKDWTKLKEKTLKLLDKKLVKDFGLKWKKALIPLIDQFINVYDGKVNSLFWNSALKTGAMRGTSIVRWAQPKIGDADAEYCGWINILFPYCEIKREGDYGFGEKNSKNKQENKATYFWNDNCKPYSDKVDYAVNGLTARDLRNGTHNSQFTLGIGCAPVKYIDLSCNKTYDLKLVSGFFGVKQDPKSFALSTNVGYFVAEKKKQF